MLISVLICTRNRADYLRATLEAFRGVAVPDGLEAELVVVDNGSTDDTPGVARAFQGDRIPVRHVVEPERGQTRARNRGLALTRGEVVLFTDDDVRPPPDWIAGLCRPMTEGTAHAVAGGVTIAPHLRRDWMLPLHRAFLASTERLDPANPSAMVGANMGFRREVLEKVPGFDPELGPGALGFHDDVLFSSQVRRAGYRIAAALDVAVEHHFDPSRLTRANFLDRAAQEGRSFAYVLHHWEHHWLATPMGCLAKRLLNGWRRLVRRSTPWPSAEGVSLAEFAAASDASFYRQLAVERARPRNYERWGLRKRHGETPALNDVREVGP